MLGVVEIGDQLFADGEQHRFQPRARDCLQRADATGQWAGDRIGGIAHGVAGELRAVEISPQSASLTTIEDTSVALTPMLARYSRCTGETLRRLTSLRSTGVPRRGCQVGSIGDGR